MYEDGIDYTTNSRSYAFAEAMAGSTVSYGIGRKKPTRKKKAERKTAKDIEYENAKKKYFEDKELGKYYKNKYNKSDINNGEPLEKNSAYIIGDRYFTYLGEFNSVKDVPNTTCCFAVGDMIYTKNRVFDESEVRSHVPVFEDNLLNIDLFLSSNAARPGEGCIVNFAHGGSVERARLVNGNHATEFYNRQFTKTEPLNFPKSFLSKLGMKDYSDKPDPNKALELLLEGNLTWNTFDKICKAAGVEYKIQLVKREEKTNDSSIC